MGASVLCTLALGRAGWPLTTGTGSVQLHACSQQEKSHRQVAEHSHHVLENPRSHVQHCCGTDKYSLTGKSRSLKLSAWSTRPFKLENVVGWLLSFFFLNEREYSQSKQNQKSFALLFCLCLHSPPHSEQHLPPSSLPAAAQPCTVPCSQERSLHSPPWSSTSSLPPSHSLPSLYTRLFLLQGSLCLRLNQACIFLAPQGKLMWNV